MEIVARELLQKINNPASQETYNPKKREEVCGRSLYLFLKVIEAIQVKIIPLANPKDKSSEKKALDEDWEVVDLTEFPNSSNSKKSTKEIKTQKMAGHQSSVQTKESTIIKPKQLDFSKDSLVVPESTKEESTFETEDPAFLAWLNRSDSEPMEAPDDFFLPGDTTVQRLATPRLAAVSGWSDDIY